MGQGAVIWVFISEIFPNRQRAFGQSLGSFTHWFFAALLTLVFPLMTEVLIPEVIFGIFCGMMILQLIWVFLFVPETKGVPLEGNGRADEFVEAKNFTVFLWSVLSPYHKQTKSRGW